MYYCYGDLVRRLCIFTILLLCILLMSVDYKDYYIDDNNILYPDDYVGTLYIPNSRINNYVLQTDNNSYYLNHDLDGNVDVRGSLFMDYRVNNDSKIIIIYGHNSKVYDIPFVDLEKYYDYNYYLSNRYIYYNDHIYYLVSVFVEVSDWSYLNVNISNYDDHYNKLLSKSFYDIDVSLSKEDDIIILQTCSYHKRYSKYNKKYLVLVGKKIK